MLLLEPLPRSTKVVYFGVHPFNEEFSRGGGDACPLELEDFPALPSDLDAHMLDFGTVGDVDHIKVFVNQDAAETWFEENDPEGVAFEYEVLE